MASTLAVSLSTNYSEWSEFFKLQNSSRFEEASRYLGIVPRHTQEVAIYAKLLGATLQICNSAATGAFPHDLHGHTVREVINEANSIGSTSVVIEGWFLAFDCFSVYRDESVVSLTALENVMDSNTRRRWIHRKGNHLISTGALNEAFDLWSGQVPSACDTKEDSDESLVSLLIDFGRLASQLGKYADAVEIYNQAVCLSQTVYNQCVSLVRLSNALERISRPAQADKRRVEYFGVIGKEYPTQCALCSGQFGKEPKFLIPCCKTITHSECLRAVVSEHQGDETDCPFCRTKFMISDVADPTAISARKYKRQKKPNETPAEGAQGDMDARENSMDVGNQD